MKIGDQGLPRAATDLLLAVAGLMFLWTVFRGNFFGRLIMFGMDQGDEAGHYALFLLTACLVSLLLAKPRILGIIERIGRKPLVPLALGLLVAAGSLLMTSSADEGAAHLALVPLGGVCVSLGLFGLVPLWGAYLAGRPRRFIFLALMLSMAVSCLNSVHLYLVPYENAAWASPVAALIPGVAYALLPAKGERQGVEAYERDGNFDLAYGKPLSTVITLGYFLALGSLYKGYELVDGGFGFPDELLIATAVLVFAFCAVVFALAVVWRDVCRTMQFSCIAMLFTYAACLLVLIANPQLPYLDAAIMACRYALTFFFIFVLLSHVRTGRLGGRTAFAAFIALQVVCAAITYCIVPILVEKTDVTLGAVGAATFILMLAAAAVLIYRLLRSMSRLAERHTGERSAVDSVVAKEAWVAACEKVSAECGLSEREAQVLPLLAKGLTRAAMAERLCVSENTVGSHLKAIYRKLGCHKKAEVIQFVDKVAQLEDVARRETR